MIVAHASDTVSLFAFALAGFVLGHVLFTQLLTRIRKGDADSDPASARFALELGLVFLVGLFLTRALAGALLAEWSRDATQPPPLETTLSVSLAANAAIVLAALAVARARQRSFRDGISIREDSARSVLVSFVVGVLALFAALPAFLAAGTLNAHLLDVAGVEPFQHSVRQLIADRDLLSSVEIVLGIGVTGPFLEEVLFRGLLLRALLSTLPPGRAVVVSAFVFALVHDVPAMLPVFVLGLAFGALYLRTRSIVAPFAAHLVFNLAQLYFVIPTAH